MPYIIETEEFEKDGMVYVRDIYSNGTTVEYPKPEPQPEWEADLIDENAEAMLEMQANIQYLVDLAEINNEEEE